jgi:hypothetical protein
MSDSDSDSDYAPDLDTEEDTSEVCRWIGRCVVMKTTFVFFHNELKLQLLLCLLCVLNALTYKKNITQDDDDIFCV